MSVVPSYNKCYSIINILLKNSGYFAFLIDIKKLILSVYKHKMQKKLKIFPIKSFKLIKVF